MRSLRGDQGDRKDKKRGKEVVRDSEMPFDGDGGMELELDLDADELEELAAENEALLSVLGKRKRDDDDSEVESVEEILEPGVDDWTSIA